LSRWIDADTQGNRCQLPEKSQLDRTVVFDWWGTLIGIAIVFTAIFTGASVASTSALGNMACIRELASVVAFASSAVIGDVYFIHQIIPLVHFEELYRLCLIGHKFITASLPLWSVFDPFRCAILIPTG
jgi:hypothetical protein